MDKENQGGYAGGAAPQQEANRRLYELLAHIQWMKDQGEVRIQQTRDSVELNAFNQGRVDAAESLQAFYAELLRKSELSGSEEETTPQLARAIELLVNVRDYAVNENGYCVVCLADPHSPGCVMELVENFIHELDGSEEEVASKWISVEDKLPEREGAYLVLDAAYANCQAIWRAGKWRADRPGGGNGIFLKHITHWQPLPNPPLANSAAPQGESRIGDVLCSTCNEKMTWIKTGTGGYWWCALHPQAQPVAPQEKP